MSETWKGDVVSLVEAFRSGERSPVDEVEATLAAIDGSPLNAFSYVDADGARQRARDADVSLPLGGVPVGVKELHHVWPPQSHCADDGGGGVRSEDCPRCRPVV